MVSLAALQSALVFLLTVFVIPAERSRQSLDLEDAHMESKIFRRKKAAGRTGVGSSRPEDWPSRWQRELDTTQATELVGGDYGTVWLAPVRCDTSTRMVVKEQTFGKGPTEEGWQREVEAMEQFKGKYFVHLYDYGKKGDAAYMMMEAMLGGELTSDILGGSNTLQGRGLYLQRVMQIFVEVVRGVAEMHQKGWIHRDLKLRNIFMTADCNAEPCHAKVADLGDACKLETEEESRWTCDGECLGTPDYMAPELYDDDQGNWWSTSPNDMWSLGVILYELVFRKYPVEIDEELSDAENLIRFNKLSISQQPIRVWTIEALNEDLKTLLARLLTPNPNERIDATGALKLAEELAKKVGANINEEDIEVKSSPPECWNKED